MLSKEWLQGCKMMADAGVMFQPDAVKALLDHIAELEEQVGDLENQLTEVMERM